MITLQSDLKNHTFVLEDTLDEAAIEGDHRQWILLVTRHKLRGEDSVGRLVLLQRTRHGSSGSAVALLAHVALWRYARICLKAFPLVMDPVLLLVFFARGLLHVCDALLLAHRVPLLGLHVSRFLNGLLHHDELFAEGNLRLDARVGTRCTRTIVVYDQLLQRSNQSHDL
ncbi:hypothetical protein L596_008814 [Steinernema carpocapsae]|uniref:Uncharacterized protein n=1 Tax=Steinernema carpocapsae TaxID=34508 RepID=A0A4U5PE40_STECR|nr:hypothetical protein L596_008814 [Steinernema carpocapsae]